MLGCRENVLEKAWRLSRANDNKQQLLMDALSHALQNMNHIGNFASSGWVMDPFDNRLDRWAVLDYDE